MTLTLNILLDEAEARVLGSLIEKELTTPEYYPLSLNALVNACNQKSNREPVVSYTALTVSNALDGLRGQGLARTMMGGDSRVPKYKHYFGEAFNLNPAEVALLCVLLLRGPQTVGELRGRTERLHQFTDLSEVEAILEGLIAREDGALVTRLPRQPGRKESRYAHLLSGEPVVVEDEPTDTEEGEVRTRGERIEALEDEVRQLRQALEELQQQFDKFKRQFE